MNPTQEPNQPNPDHDSQTYDSAILVEIVAESVGPGHPDFPERERQAMERRKQTNTPNSNPTVDE